MLSASNAVAIVIDVQGRLAEMMFERERLYQQLRIFLRGVRILGLPTLWLEQYPQGLGRTVPQVADLLDGLRPLEKTSFSACGSDAFRRQLQATARRQVLLVGIESHVCVYQSARDLLDTGYHVEIVGDAISSRSERNYRLGLRRMVEAGARLSSVEMALFELLRQAGSPQFKEISRLVR